MTPDDRGLRFAYGRGTTSIAPAAVASLPAQIALVMAFGTRSVSSLFDDSLSDWASTLAWLGALIALGYVGVVLPATKLLADRQAGTLATIFLLVIAALVGGAAIIAVLYLPAVLGGGDPMSVLHLSPLGSMVGLIALLVWLPFNADLLCRAVQI